MALALVNFYGEPSTVVHHQDAPASTGQVGQDNFALQLLWLLQALAAEAPTERWADTMRLGTTGWMDVDHPGCCLT